MLELLRGLPGIGMLRGNIDLVERYATMAAGIGWTQGVLDEGGLLDVLTGLPARLRLRLPGGAAVLGVHASPRADDGPGIDPDIAGEQLQQLLDGCGADVVTGGHTHAAADRLAGGIRALNPGSTGLPRTCGTANWLLLQDDGDDLAVTHRSVPFDVEQVVGAVRAVTRIFSKDELLPALLSKLAEEAAEAGVATVEDLPTELVDVLEVVRALAPELGLSWSSLLALATEKRYQRGGEIQPEPGGRDADLTSVLGAGGGCSPLCHYRYESRYRRTQGVLMNRLRSRLLAAAAVIAVASFTGGTAASASVMGDGNGTGTTASIADANAINNMIHIYFGCENIMTLYDVQVPNGTWDAEVTGTCMGVR